MTSLIFMVFLTYYFVTVPGLAGLSAVTLETVAALAVVSVAIFYVSKAYRRRQGIELDTEFREIPPD